MLKLNKMENFIFKKKINPKWNINKINVHLWSWVFAFKKVLSSRISFSNVLNWHINNKFLVNPKLLINLQLWLQIINPLIYKAYSVAKNNTSKILITSSQKQQYLKNTFINFYRATLENKNNHFLVLSNSINMIRLINNFVLSSGTETIIKERLPLISTIATNYTKQIGLVFTTNEFTTLKKEVRKYLLPETALCETFSQPESSFTFMQFQRFNTHLNSIYIILKMISLQNKIIKLKTNRASKVLKTCVPIPKHRRIR